MDLNDSQARAAITALTSKYLSPYLSIYSNVTPDTYLSFQMGVYNTLIKGAPSHPEVYKLSNLYAFKAVAVSILTAGHYSKTAFDTNNPLYNPGVFGDKYIEKYLSPTIIVDWLTPNLNTLERQKIFSKFTSGELDQKSFVAAIGLALAKGQALTSTTILEARESLYGDDVTLDSSFRTTIADTVGTDAIDTVHMNGDAWVYIKEYSQTDHTFMLTNAQTSKETKLVGVERVEFNDGKRLALDIEGNAGQTYRL